jgi:hypothetical protein
MGLPSPLFSRIFGFIDLRKIFRKIYEKKELRSQNIEKKEVAGCQLPDSTVRLD